MNFIKGSYALASNAVLSQNIFETPFLELPRDCFMTFRRLLYYFVATPCVC